MRRLKPMLKRWFLWVVNPALFSFICFESDRLNRLVDSHSRYRKPLKKILDSVELMGILSALLAIVAGFFLVIWSVESIKKKGWAETFLFDPVLAKRDGLVSASVRNWGFFFLRAVCVFGLFMATMDIIPDPAGLDAVRRFLARNASCIWALTPLFLIVSAARYAGDDDTLSTEKPELCAYLNGPGGILPMKPLHFHIDRERRTEAWWDMAVLAHSRYEAEGKLADGSVFSVKLEYRMPWFRSARLAAILRIHTAEKRSAATISAQASTLFPTEAAVNMEPVLSEAQAFLLPRDSSFLVVTSHYVQASLPRISSVTEAFEAVWIALRIQANLQASRDGGYRGDSQLSATPAEIAQIEAIAEEAWTSFPSKPRGSQP